MRRLAQGKLTFFSDAPNSAFFILPPPCYLSLSAELRWWCADAAVGAVVIPQKTSHLFALLCAYPSISILVYALQFMHRGCSALGQQSCDTQSPPSSAPVLDPPA